MLAVLAAVAILTGAAGCGPPTYSRTGATAGSGGTGVGGPVGQGGGGQVGTGGTGGPVGPVGPVGSGGTVLGSGGASGGAGGRGPGTGGSGTGGSGTGGTATGGRGTGGTGTGGTGTGGVGAGGSATGGIAGDVSRYNFEAGVQGWIGAPDAGLTPVVSVTTSAAQRFAGGASLAAALALPAGALSALVVSPPTPALPAGATVTFRVYVPGGALLDWVQPYVQEVGPAFTFTPPVGGAQLYTAGIWNTFTVVVPPTSVSIGTIGVQFHTSVAWTGIVYLDSVNY